MEKSEKIKNEARKSFERLLKHEYKLLKENKPKEL